ncbi:MAG: hypothetical protein UX26_C0039G0006 [Parcubacteria group bacterium GW2011_GWC1_45_9]|nr:MAG: hypothetical protein UX26_C0039G0006 [Parcubacteria group bacterium GW2011_GWC1_45_9]
MINLPPEKLKDILVKQGLIDPALFDNLQIESQRKRQDLADILISQGLVNKDYLYLLIARALGVERVNPSAGKPTADFKWRWITQPI